MKTIKVKTHKTNRMNVPVTIVGRVESYIRNRKKEVLACDANYAENMAALRRRVQDGQVAQHTGRAIEKWLEANAFRKHGQETGEWLS